MSRDAYDVLVIGGGHAGAEAAWAAGRLGARTALITFDRAAIGRMSCNPAIGGIGKGQMVREIDALGGLMGLVADETGIQFRMLNRRKGPALWAPRCQSDSAEYPRALQRRLTACPNLTIIEAGVDAILADDAPSSAATDSPARRRVTGVLLSDGHELRCAAVIVTSGTFLGALMHTGERKTPGGRVGEAAATALSDSLRALGLRLGRLKTGTPPRVARETVDFSRLDEQPGDDDPAPFSHLTDRLDIEQVVCWISFTNPDVHELIRANLHRAPMYSGQIQAGGPRYCPSIEDKVVRFADKQRHQLFLEPEGRDSERIYVNGISTSLPIDVQQRIVAQIDGLRNARVLQWGYAVEYDFVPPEQIDASLMTKTVAGLFLAGQINGTSGYEEAAGQGLVAGVNAARYVAGRSPWILGRDQAYIGVMIDDLVTRGVVEPYRMFTSRAEHRLHLRYDNADLRLTPIGRELGLVDDLRWRRYEQRKALVEALRQTLHTTRWNGKTLAEKLREPTEDGGRFVEIAPGIAPAWSDRTVRATVVNEIRYAGYLERQSRAIEEFRSLEDREIPDNLRFEDVRHLRREAIERWSAIRPKNVGQASRVSGVRPTDVQLLLLHLSRADKLNKIRIER
ncbi:MAG: tRNA uridine-5-carboxymethylaminomethyl(34) synthesis enzyme MnmG [Planctomycetota bacterium]|nr:MAG: tRNA uridine-5-carboxymethylaminomethyl(34) synthesis enzyme MnmG [Planctomycetota bacterium]